MSDGPLWICGASGLVGSAIARLARARGRAALTPSRSDLDLMDGGAVQRWVASHRPGAVVVAAAKVGGIRANNAFRYDFILSNLMIAGNVIEACRLAGTPRLVFLGSSCIYPRDCPQPMREEHLLSGALEQTNEPYAVAKIAGLKLVESCNRQYGTRWISAMPTNLYGPGDNYHAEDSHVLPALLRRFHEAAAAGHAPVTVWGSGSARREFLHSDDAAAGILHLLDHGQPGTTPNDCFNLGSGQEVTIAELATRIQQVTGHRGELRWDRSKPDGTPRKLLDSSRLSALGWTPGLSLAEGLASAYGDFRARLAAGTLRI